LARHFRILSAMGFHSNNAFFGSNTWKEGEVISPKGRCFAQSALWLECRPIIEEV
jgi:hypothetical protein